MGRRIGLPDLVCGWGVLVGALSVAEGVCGGVVGVVVAFSGVVVVVVVVFVFGVRRNGNVFARQRGASQVLVA